MAQTGRCSAAPPDSLLGSEKLATGPRDAIRSPQLVAWPNVKKWFRSGFFVSFLFFFVVASYVFSWWFLSCFGVFLGCFRMVLGVFWKVFRCFLGTSFGQQGGVHPSDSENGSSVHGS